MVTFSKESEAVGVEDETGGEAGSEVTDKDVDEGMGAEDGDGSAIVEDVGIKDDEVGDDEVENDEVVVGGRDDDEENDDEVVVGSWDDVEEVDKENEEVEDA